jgi:hypothetical protein
MPGTWGTLSWKVGSKGLRITVSNGLDGSSTYDTFLGLALFTS